MATIPATLPITTITTGEAWTIKLSALFRDGTERFNVTGHTLPFPNLAPKTSVTNATTVEGKPTAAGVYTVPLVGRDSGNDPTGQVDTLTIHVTVPGHEFIIPTVSNGVMSATVPLNTAVSIPLSGAMTGRTQAWKATGVPAWLTVKPNALVVQELRGTATEWGTWTIALTGSDKSGNDTGQTSQVTVTAAGPVTVIPAPAAERTEDGYTLPAVEGVRWMVNGAETAPGSYSVQPVAKTITVTIIPEALAGWKLDPPAVPLVLTFEPAPGTDPDPEPGENDEEAWARLLDDDPQALYVATRLADRIIRHVGRDVADLEPAEVLTARDHAMVVLEYVKGYTRGRGFVGYIPHRSLQAVIVAAAARLFTNPEQLTYYSTGDYSERPATMTGWTAAELGVLRRFRRIYR